MTADASMRFERLVFLIAGIYGVVAVAPLYFIFDLIGRYDPPAITHPAFFYGFVGVALSWQVAFVILAADPVRYRVMMIPSILEKFSYGGAVVMLFLKGQVRVSDLGFGIIDLMFGCLFLVAYYKTGITNTQRKS
jgi:hypothetical protein